MMQALEMPSDSQNILVTSIGGSILMTVKLFKLGQLLNKPYLIVVTLSGITKLVKLVHFSKAYVSMVVTLLGMLKDVRLEQFLKEPLLIVVTVLGISILLRL